MSAQQLITEHIDLWTSTVKAKKTQGRGSNKKRELYGIKKLRELILELAVRGKLVPQDPNDEPANVLLERIAAEKSQLIKDRKTKKQKPFPEITEEEKPFELPDGWEWLHLTDAGHDWGQKTPEHEFTYIDVGSINKELGIIAGPKVLNADEAPSRARKIVKNGTIIYSTVRPYLLNIAVINDDFYPEPIASTAFAILHPFSGLTASFIYRYLRSPAFITYVESVQTGIAYPAVNDMQFFSGILPIPPTSEQHRIVAKVDELMALCDQLEQQTESSLDAHNLLVDTLLATLTDAHDAKELSDNWARFMATDGLYAGNAGAISGSPSVFDTLITTDYAVEQLKQTILQLAVQGKLVPQDPNDEPASELLERIAAEKAQLIKNKKIKKQKLLPKITDEERLFELPNGWSWEFLGNLSSDIHYGYTASAKPENEGIRLLRITDIQNDKVNWTTVPGCEITDSKAENYLLIDDDILIARTGGTIGKSYLVENIDVKAVFASYLIRVKRISAMYSAYIKTYLGSAVYWLQLYDNASGTGQPNVNATALKQLLVPIPPLSEQHRIVAKVDELMSLCDQLKAQLNVAQTTQLHLSDAVVENALTV